MGLKAMGCDTRDWIALAEDRDQWWVNVLEIVRGAKFYRNIRYLLCPFCEKIEVTLKIISIINFLYKMTWCDVKNIIKIHICNERYRT